MMIVKRLTFGYGSFWATRRRRRISFRPNICIEGQSVGKLIASLSSRPLTCTAYIQSFGSLYVNRSEPKTTKTRTCVWTLATDVSVHSGLWRWCIEKSRRKKKTKGKSRNSTTSCRIVRLCAFPFHPRIIKHSDPVFRTKPAPLGRSDGCNSRLGCLHASYLVPLPLSVSHLSLHIMSYKSRRRRRRHRRKG